MQQWVLNKLDISGLMDCYYNTIDILREIAVIFNQPWETFVDGVRWQQMCSACDTAESNVYPTGQFRHYCIYIVPSSMLMGNGTVS